MKILINDHRKLFAIKEEFNKAFPNFKIEFFEKPSKAGAVHSKKMVAHDSKTLGECRLAHNKGELSFNAGMTAGEVEQNFQDVYELFVKVLQKSGKEWRDAAANAILSSEAD